MQDLVQTGDAPYAAVNNLKLSTEEQYDADKWFLFIFIFICILFSS